MIDRKVPMGISRLSAGTIAVITFPAVIFLYFAWLPRCETKTNPSARRIAATLRDENSLDMLQFD
jgi:hypothetical protein